jgi:REP element-mobilizing transposase RayT
MRYSSRRSNRLPEYDYAREGAYSITVCTHRRRHLFGEVIDEQLQMTLLAQIVSTTWYAIPTHFPNVTLDAFIIMPDHLHGIIVLGQPAIINITGAMNCAPTKTTLGNVVRAFKARVTAAANRARGNIGTRVWQRDYYDRIVRNVAELDRTRQYIADNPRNWQRDPRGRQDW